MARLISIDLKASFGFLKKPDINEGIYLTYNLLHKPGLLGILGAVAGLEGYKSKDELPEYYQKLKNLRIGIRPLNAERGIFSKTVVKYNNSVGYASREPGCILNISEQMLIHPSFRCYLMLEDGNASHVIVGDRLAKCEAEYIPYLGKNEHALSWENFREYEFQPFQFDRDFKIASIFMKGKEIIKRIMIKTPPALFSVSDYQPAFACFEELPVGFDEQLFQYHKELFVYSSFTLPKEAQIENLWHLKDSDEIIQLF
ncbi:MAG: type I-B CRISPR-associated protein Cas5 [bacterium]